MKTIVLCAIVVLELVSSFPFPEPAYYDTYEPTEIQIPTLAHSPDLYEQQQRYIKQQNDNIRRQNYENLLRNQILTRPSYNIQPVLNTVRDPYIDSIPLQRPLQRAQYEAPLTPQYYPVQRQQPIRQYQPVQSQDFQVATEAHAEAGNSQGASQQTHNPYHYTQFNAQNLASHPRIQQILASTPLKKRYLVLHPNGTIEHIDKIEHIVEQHPNYILLNAGSVTPHNESKNPGSAQNPVVPQAPVAPVAPNSPVTPAVPNAPVAPAVPNAPVAPAVPNAPVAPATPNAPVAPTAPVIPAAPVSPNAPVPPVPVAPSPPPAPVAQAPNAPTAPISSAAPNAPVAPAAAAQINTVPTPPVAPAPFNPAPAPVKPAPAPVNSPVPVGPIAGPSPNSKPISPRYTSIQTGIVPGPKPTVQPPTGPTPDLPPALNRQSHHQPAQLPSYHQLHPQHNHQYGKRLLQLSFTLHQLLLYHQ
ncbi:uncharacterized protein LOC134666177 [Cydia fagiglandana]|uniref:uncharacterized protein LOC134666177 n=1 Tax=Cydia fagiglandana TaxID=1458189 RepID=UPI002FEE2CF0